VPSATIVIPAGTFVKWRNSLRPPGEVSASDLTADDLRRLDVRFRGQPLTAGQFRFGAFSFDGAGHLRITLHLTGIAGPGVLRVATPDSGVVLLAIIGPSSAGSVTVDLASTAAAVLEATLQGRPAVSTTDRQNLLAIVTRDLERLFTSSRTANVDTEPEFQGLIRRIAVAIDQQIPLDQDALLKIETPPSKGGGGGGAVAVAPIYTIDQLDLTNVAGVLPITTTVHAAQDFLVPTAGRITKIDVRLNDTGPDADLTLSIKAANAGANNAPTGVSLGDATATVTSAIPGMVTFTFAAPVTVAAGTRYTFELVSNNNGAQAGNVQPSAYADGQAHSDNDFGAGPAYGFTHTLLMMDTRDLVFQIVIQP
jgi:hypothetical protein